MRASGSFPSLQVEPHVIMGLGDVRKLVAQELGEIVELRIVDVMRR